MISKYSHKKLNWVDLESPKEEELLHVIEQYSIPLNIKEKIIERNNEDKIEINFDYIYIQIKNKITFVVNNHILLSIHDRPMQALTESSKEMELDIVSGEKIDSNQLLLTYLIKNIYINQEEELSILNNQIKKLNNRILKKDKKIKKLKIIIILLIMLSLISIWF